ncbi:MAG: AAA family ATPase, partial [Slackia sp.]
NEAGKTTVSAFVGGVLFGWEDARGQKNTYKPPFAQRSGTLRFVDDEGRFHELSRTRNADGLSCSSTEAKRIADSLDKETFKTMFSLDSDELRSLGSAANMTSKLLTAGSGTGISPAEALRAIDESIAARTSRSASANHSLVRIQAEEDECKRRLALAREESDQFKKEGEEYEDLLRRKDERLAEIGRLNARIELLGACEVEIRRTGKDESFGRGLPAAIALDEAVAGSGFASARRNACGR